jgi:5-oxoprolinase (ATP-hydrolysing)
LAAKARTDAKAKAHVPFWAEGAHHQAPVLERSEMRPGQEAAGPAIILEPTSTTIVEPGWTADATPRGMPSRTLPT